MMFHINTSLFVFLYFLLGGPLSAQSSQDEYPHPHRNGESAFDRISSMYLEILYTSVKSECHRAENPTLQLIRRIGNIDDSLYFP